MPTEREFTVHFHADPDGGYTVLVPALPEVVTEGDTMEEARAMAREAIAAVLEMYDEEGWEVPDDPAPTSERISVAA